MSDTPRTDELAQGWDEGLAMPSQMLTLACQLERENAALRADRDRLDFLESITGSGWALLHLDEGKQLTRKQIDRRMATEPKP